MHLQPFVLISLQQLQTNICAFQLFCFYIFERAFVYFQLFSFSVFLVLYLYSSVWAQPPYVLCFTRLILISPAEFVFHSWLLGSHCGFTTCKGCFHVPLFILTAFFFCQRNLFNFILILLSHPYQCYHQSLHLWVITLHDLYINMVLGHDFINQIFVDLFNPPAWGPDPILRTPALADSILLSQ